MQAANPNVAANENSGANGHTPLHDLFVLTDEQILEIEPEAQDASVREEAAQGDSPASVPANANERESRNNKGLGPSDAAAAEQQSQSAQARVPVLPEPPTWLAETMNDPQRGAEARALWDGAQRAEREAASFREVFAKPEEARASAERARVLDDIDRAYFAGDSSQRAQLAARMMREDPAAFREMVAALQRAGQAPPLQRNRILAHRNAMIRGKRPSSRPTPRLNVPPTTIWNAA
jgi:hypothetical protein